MSNELIFQIEESPEGGYEARALGHSIFTEGDTYDEIKVNIKDAIECHFESKNVSIHLNISKEQLIKNIFKN